MLYEELVRDFVYRTRVNLEVVRREEKAGQEAYEVTQLINSMIGLLLLPREEFLEKLPPLSIAELEQLGWPIPRIFDGYEQARDLKDLARRLRNGIAHCHLEPTEAGGNIDGLIIWNQWKKQKTWKAQLKIEELEAFTTKLTDMLLE